MNAALGLWLFSRQDGPVRVGRELWAGPLVVVLVHVTVALMFAELTAVLRRHGRVQSARGITLGAPAAVFLLGWLPCLPGAPASTPAPTPPAQGRDIVLITLDTVRADHLGAAGGPVPTPALDALAAAGVRYTQAVTTAPLTAPAHASLFTGQDPFTHGVTRNGSPLMAPESSVIPAVQAAGYRTGAVVGSHVLDRSSGLGAGFEHLDDRWGIAQRIQWIPALAWLEHLRRPTQRRGAEVVSRARAWLRDRDPRPTFLWVHLYDAHAPYGPPRAFRPSEDELTAIAAAARADATPGAFGGLGDGTGLLTRAMQADAPRRRALYAAEVRYVDQMVGRLLADVSDDAIVIVAGDHGESLGEHDYHFNHGANLYEPSLHIPLILRWPDDPRAGKTVDELRSIADVARWIRRAAGLEQGGPALPPTAGVHAFTTGQQARLRVGQGSTRRGATQPVAALRVDHGKVVVADGAPRWFDLEQDPGELASQPVPPAHVATASALADQVDGAVVERNADDEARLRALGYVD